METARRGRIEVQLPPSVGTTRERELSGFVRYCIRRIEAELGERERWDVRIGVSRAGFRTQVVLEHYGLTLDTRSAGHDAALAVWDAMCRLEQLLRERHDAIAFEPRAKSRRAAAPKD
jgi:hypothetical protein